MSLGMQAKRDSKVLPEGLAVQALTSIHLPSELAFLILSGQPHVVNENRHK